MRNPPLTLDRGRGFVLIPMPNKIRKDDMMRVGGRGEVRGRRERWGEGGKCEKYPIMMGKMTSFLA